MVRPVKSIDLNLFLVVGKYFALQLSVLPVSTGRATEREAAGGAEEVSGHRAQAGQADRHRVVVGANRHRLLSTTLRRC